MLRGDNGVQFFISHLASWLRTRRFSEPTFRPSAPIIGKTRCFATFLPFRTPGSSFFGDFLFLIFFLLFSDSSHLCFSSVHIVGSLTSKLPSTRPLSRARAVHRYDANSKKLEVPHPSPTGGAQLSSYD